MPRCIRKVCYCIPPNENAASIHPSIHAWRTSHLKATSFTAHKITARLTSRKEIKEITAVTKRINCGIYLDNFENKISPRPQFLFHNFVFEYLRFSSTYLFNLSVNSFSFVPFRSLISKVSQGVVRFHEISRGRGEKTKGGGVSRQHLVKRPHP